jgi:ABC-type multidrug transport system permease subunit
MKTTQAIIALTSMSIGFICSYFMELTMQNAEQYLAITTLVFADGFFGIIAGIKEKDLKLIKQLKF